MKTTAILIIFSLSLLNSCGNNNMQLKEINSSTNDSLILIETVHTRENAMKKKDISTVMSNFKNSERI